MAGIKTVIQGDASSLVSAMDKGERAVNGVSKAFQDAKEQVKAFDAAARRNSLEMYDKSARSAAASVAKLTREIRGLSLVKNPSFSFGVGANPNMIPQLNNELPKVTQNFKSANGVAIEFNRIIQDAPFGIIGIGNNITQLASSFGTLKAQTGSTGAALKATFASILSSGNLISLGISAAVTGFTLWQMHAQKTKKATKDLEDGTKTYIDTLKGVTQASARGQEEAVKEVTGLRMLYNATQNLTIPMDKRLKAAKELIKQYPKQFEGLTKEAILAGKASEAFDKLTKSITSTAVAAAYVNKMTENAQKQLNNYLQIIDKQNEANRLSIQIEKEKAKQLKQTAAGSAGVGASGAAQATLGSILDRQRAEILKEINTLGEENGKIEKENSLIQQQYNSQIALGADASGKLNTSIEKVKDNSKEIASVINDLTGTVLSEFDRKVFDINTRYEDIFKTIGKIGNAGKQKDAFGLATQAKQLELLRLQAEKFLYLTDVSKVKPAGISGVTSIPINRPDALPGVEAATIKANKRAISDLGKAWEKEVDDMRKSLGRAVSNFGRDMIGTLSKINQQSDRTFRGVVSTLLGSLTGGIAEVMQTSLMKSLEKFIGDKMKDLGPVGSNIAGGLGIAGSLVSGTTKRTSSIGQAAGGALTGAAAGMMFSPYGAAVGALVGAVSGLLSAASARKQEKIQEQQLAEQRKQTAIMERQNALAFASSIIGQMTTNGLITNIDRNAKGELVTKISGQDLVLLMQRAGGTR